MPPSAGTRLGHYDVTALLGERGAWDDSSPFRSRADRPMGLAPGMRIDHYDVTSLLGEGGMGQVWQATDTQLSRQVALKILPDAFAADSDRLARFKREAQIFANLNHPNIAAIYGIEESDDIRALVLELVEGPTLADRISKGPIPLDEALPIAKQIAETLEAAHEAGVIHRDLKPADVALWPGRVRSAARPRASRLLDTRLSVDSVSAESRRRQDAVREVDLRIPVCRW